MILLLADVVLLFVIVTSIVSGYRFYTDKVKSISSSAFAYTRAASEFIDGDRIDDYVRTGEPDDYYNEVQRYLDIGLKEAGLKYYYVFVPYEDDLIYIWDAKSGYGTPSEIGYREEYMEGGKEAVKAIMRPDPPEIIKITKNDDNYGSIATAFSPVFNSDGEPVAVVGVDLAIEDIQRQITTLILALVIALIITGAVFGIVLYMIINAKVVTPIRKLNNATKDMVSNLDTENDFSVDVNTGDELEELADSFKNMHSDLRNYIDQLSAVTAEKERIGTELELATRIQADMLPNDFPAFPERSDFDIHASMTPAKEVGGDFYDFFMTDDDHLALVMADVSGKGVPAALFMMMSKIMIRNFTMTGDTPAEVLMKVNQQICANNREEMFVTVWLGILDLATGVLKASNAGHEYPILKRPDGRFEVFMDKHGFVVGGMPGVKYSDYEIKLEPGSKLFLYTDGIPEATDKDGNMFGIDRTAATLNLVSNCSPKEINDVIYDTVGEFVGDAPRFDDMTMMCINYIGGKDPDKMNGNEITIEATLSNIGVVTDFVNLELEKLNCSLKIMTQIDIAIDELFSNIARYAYNPETGPATVRVEVEDDPAAVVITFIDHGIPYDPMAKEDPDITLSAEDRPIGGLGIFMVKKTMDSVTYEYKNGQNILHIKKLM